MRRAIIGVVAMLLGCGLAAAETVTFTGATSMDWNTASNWDAGRVPNTSDIAIIGGDNDVTTTQNVVAGEVRFIGSGTLSFGAYTLECRADNGASGGYYHVSNDTPDSLGYLTVYGNFSYDLTLSSAWATFPSVIDMRGNDTYYREVYARNGDTVNIYGTGVFDNGSYSDRAQGTTTVKAGGSIAANPAGASTWSNHRFIFEGGQSNLPAAGANVNFKYEPIPADNGTMNLVVASGVIYPQDVSFYNPWNTSNPNTPYTWRLQGGDLGVDRDLILVHYSDQISVHLSTLENGTTTSRDLAVGRDLKVGSATNPATRNDMVLFNASNVKIARDFLLYRTGTADLGSATVRLGRNLTLVSNAHQVAIDDWDAGTSTLICDGDCGTYAAQALTPYSVLGFNLHNLHIDTAGTVSLAGNAGGDLTLTGDLKVLAGTFNANGRQITFNGDPHYFEAAAGATYDLDNVVLIENAVLYLLSDMTIDAPDNLVMLAGSELHLNGWTLNADGETYSGAGSWANDDGMIIGDVIPEPGTMLLLGTGLIGVIGVLRRRRMK